MHGKYPLAEGVLAREHRALLEAQLVAASHPHRLAVATSADHTFGEILNYST